LDLRVVLDLGISFLTTILLFRISLHSLISFLYVGLPLVIILSVNGFFVVFPSDNFESASINFLHFSISYLGLGEGDLGEGDFLGRGENFLGRGENLVGEIIDFGLGGEGDFGFGGEDLGLGEGDLGFGGEDLGFGDLDDKRLTSGVGSLGNLEIKDISSGDNSRALEFWISGVDE